MFPLLRDREDEEFDADQRRNALYSFEDAIDTLRQALSERDELIEHIRCLRIEIDQQRARYEAHNGDPAELDSAAYANWRDLLHD